MEYRKQPAKSALQRVDGMPFRWSLNPYRGCRHACLYCYARIYHSYIGFEDPADFDRIILHKDDLPDRLRAELHARRTPLEGEIAIGTATDPYQPIEAKEHVTRRLLEVLLEAGRSVSITTKSPLVTRDLDLLRAFAAYGGVRVNVTVTVLDDGLWRLLEPMTPSPTGRLAALSTLADAGIPTSVFLAPVVPQIGDEDALRVLAAAAEAHVGHVMVQVLRLAPGVGEWLLPRLRALRPSASARLESLYRHRQTLSTEDRDRILGPILERRRAYRLERPLPALRTREAQLTLFSGSEASFASAANFGPGPLRQ